MFPVLALLQSVFPLSSCKGEATSHLAIVERRASELYYLTVTQKILPNLKYIAVGFFPYLVAEKLS